VIFAQTDIVTLLAIVVALVVGITCHEFSHALVADYLGDHRPRAMGRVSLNPIRHIDPLGALLFIAAGFGWGRPVMVNAAAMRGGRRSMAWVAAAGPIANIAVAVLFAVVFRAMLVGGISSEGPLSFIFELVRLNLVLAIFNFIPIPPLDGYSFLMALVPFRTALQLQPLAQYGFYLLLGLVLLSYLSPGASPLYWLFSATDSLARVLVGA
jgi:Zn-dependent protease